ncbi:DRMBL domain-containing protein/Lactamase_B_2 domain-containing protein [Cephalotus follicularis]|uniref:DRMBL domain-containing protein/Lactamase_B_2 domain-containing protein n=1 Tax=Cephalotus follicularis TaxID=3775 RepID=A0A1Q3C3Z8_CEPFO|nr:DRMBL domain-containing protein/Lactamase_B_2 domain-containing protein [Cephalotus follicularis]
MEVGPWCRTYSGNLLVLEKLLPLAGVHFKAPQIVGKRIAKMGSEEDPPPFLDEFNYYDDDDDDDCVCDAFEEEELEGQGQEGRSTHRQGEEEEEEESFAADFYRCGTDWFSVLLKNQHPINKTAMTSQKRKLKQANLLQMWGFNKPNNDSDSLPMPPPPTNKKMKHAATNNFHKACPFYKKIPGTSFTVDAFRYGVIQGCSAYFLTHFHSDHYGGLTKAWSHAPIYCTPLTSNLIKMCLRVDPLYICSLELNTQHDIEGIKVTFLEANHCPGAALIHFRLPSGQSYLHTGDFRACKEMQTYPLLVNQPVNLLYLDTTYCNPKYRFPSKEDVLSYVVRVTKKCLTKQPATLVVVGAYSIGKECVYLAISKAVGVKIYANASRRRILQSFDWPELSGNLCIHGKETLLHVLPISSLRFETLKDYLKTYANQYSSVLAFRPTGWTHSESVGNKLDLIKPSSRGNITIYGVPYSEHSSFTELREFVQFMKPDKIIPTVNVGNPATRDKMQSYFRDWLKN